MGKMGEIEGEPDVLYPERRFDSILELVIGEQANSLLGKARLPKFHLSYLFVPPTP